MTSPRQYPSDDATTANENSHDANNSHAPHQPETEKKRRGLIFYLQMAAFVLGAALLVGVIRKVGVGEIFDALRQIGFGFFTLLGIIGLRHAIRTVSMWVAVPREHRHFGFVHAFTTRLSGETISFLTFTGPVLGEATKAALLRKRVPLASSVHALVVDNLLYNLSVALFIACGACVMLATYDLPIAARYPLIFIAAGMMLALLAVVWLVISRHMPATSTVEWLIRKGLKRSWLTSKRDQVQEAEEDVYNFYHERPRTFFVMAACDLLAHGTSVLEVYVTLRMLGFTTSFSIALIIESLTKVINLVFGFVPATIGVYEGGTGFILSRLGYTNLTGVSLGIVRKAGMVVWAGIGLLTLVRHTAPDILRKIFARYPRLRKVMDNLVLSNIAHRPARTFVSVLGVAVGVLLVVFTVGLAHGVLRERGRREAGIGAEIMLRASGTTGLTGTQRFAIPVSHAEEISHLEGVRIAVPVGQNTDSSDTGFGMRVIDGIPFEQYAEMAHLQMIDGRALASAGDEAIIDAKWRDDHKARVGDKVRLYGRDFQIVGVYAPPGGGRIKIPLSTMQEQVGSVDRCASILISCNNPLDQEKVAALIHDKFPDEQIIFTRDLQEIYATGVPALNVFINVIVGVAASISLLVILLAMYTTVTERTRQIGVLKSLGMGSLNIAWIIEQEALLVSVLGVLLGLALTLAARFLIMHTTSLTVDIEPRWLGVALLIGLLGGTLGALYPALRAARQDAVEALSYE